MSAIAVSQVSVEIAGKPIISEVSMDIEAGSWVGIVGPNGALYTLLDEALEGYAVARINLDDVRRTREERQLIQCRQPQAYRAVVRKY